MNKAKAARIIVQITAFSFVALCCLLLSFPGRFAGAKEIFMTSPTLLLFASLAAVYAAKGILLLIVFAAAAFLFGRVFCGWLCPFGAAMDFFAFLTKPFKKRKESEPDKKLMIKYYLLAFFALLAALGYQFVWLLEPVTVFSRFFHLSFFPFINKLSDTIFRYVIINYGFGENIRYTVSNNVFSAGNFYFACSAVFFLLFAVPVFAAAVQRRFWCRYLCPLGASLGILSVKAVFPLRKEPCLSNCGQCVRLCRSNAIKSDGSCLPSECVMCMDCKSLKCYRPAGANAPKQEKKETAKILSAALPEKKKEPGPDGGKISRKEFVFWGGGALAAVYALARKSYSSSKIQRRSVIRPPGAISEKEFKQACVRCGNCMKVCVTNGLQPVILESGLDGVWTPKLDNITGYCEYNCNACGQVCPTQAIKALSAEEKTLRKIGNAVIIKEKCVPWKDGIECLVCEEHCPVPEKAIKFVRETINGKEINAPAVDFHLCIGCGICENKCPVEGRGRGIIVEPM